MKRGLIKTENIKVNFYFKASSIIKSVFVLQKMNIVS